MGSLSYMLGASGKRREGNGWLGTWGKRLKITVDNTNVDSNLENFPILVYLSAASGIGDVDVSCIFDELTSDENRTKIAVTTSNGETECYVEIERWDDANEVAWLWVKVPSVLAASATELYIYYDSAHAANTDKVGDIGSTPGENVWDANFKLVCHMRDATTSTVKDSTSNGNDGTKKGANEPIEAAGHIDKCQKFDGTDDTLHFGHDASLQPASAITVEASIKTSTTTQYAGIVDKYTGTTYGYMLDFNDTTGHLRFLVAHKAFDEGGATASVAVNDNAYHHVAGFYDSTNVKIYIDGIERGTDAYSQTIGYDSHEVYVGGDGVSTLLTDIDVDEVRISSNARPVAWLKATRYSNRDEIAAYGEEETP